jgi:hypothetical protein
LGRTNEQTACSRTEKKKDKANTANACTDVGKLNVHPGTSLEEGSCTRRKESSVDDGITTKRVNSGPSGRE